MMYHTISTVACVNERVAQIYKRVQRILFKIVRGTKMRLKLRLSMQIGIIWQGPRELNCMKQLTNMLFPISTRHGI